MRRPLFSSSCLTKMAALVFFVAVVLIIGLTVSMGSSEEVQAANRSFSIDHEANTFLMDGKPFRYVSGSFHYFRALPDSWPKRLKTMRAAGLNAVDTYVEWSLHNPHDNVYKWGGIAEIQRFLELAHAEGFYVILRPGPYICAERDNGGLPHWLFTKYPNIKLRTSDPDYLREVEKWYSKIMPRLQRFFYVNGGPIIMVQIENEYGVFDACDHEYLNWLRDETEKYVQGNALLFTTDIPNDRIKCGKIDGVFATTDFGIDRVHELADIWKTLRSVQPTGPLVNSEFYPGWLTHWQEQNQRRDAKEVAEALRKILESGASVNVYMFFGGTNFGFTAGANDFVQSGYTADITSYDYDAPMDEPGNITEKFLLMRDVIKDYLKTDPPSIPAPIPRISYGEILLTPILDLLSADGRTLLANGTPRAAIQPISFEELDQYSGLVLYETMLSTLELDPTQLTVHNLRDRALVYVDQNYVGVLSRANEIYSLPLSAGWGTKLQLLVENEGRINFNTANDTKGIFGNVTIQKRNGETENLTNWISTSYPLKDSYIQSLVLKYKDREIQPQVLSDNTTMLSNGPKLFYGKFTVKEVGDTFLNTIGWGKGVVYVNSFNLGRYWPLAGPQLTLYVPNELLQVGENTLVLLEYQKIKVKNVGLKNWGVITLDDKPQLDG